MSIHICVEISEFNSWFKSVECDANEESPCGSFMAPTQCFCERDLNDCFTEAWSRVLTSGDV